MGRNRAMQGGVRVEQAGRVYQEQTETLQHRRTHSCGPWLLQHIAALQEIAAVAIEDLRILEARRFPQEIRIALRERKEVGEEQIPFSKETFHGGSFEGCLE